MCNIRPSLTLVRASQKPPPLHTSTSAVLASDTSKKILLRRPTLYSLSKPVSSMNRVQKVSYNDQMWKGKDKKQKEMEIKRRGQQKGTINIADSLRKYWQPISMCGEEHMTSPLIFLSRYICGLYYYQYFLA